MSTTVSDPTFRSYSADEAKVYATNRLSYSEALYNVVLQHHAATAGQFNLLLDVGCGPGNATRDMALSFDKAIGTDPGEEMIGAARDLGGKTKSGDSIQYEVCGAEEISRVKGLEGGVDLLIAAMAAHWFDMDKFWAEAAKVVKPGGTVALWTCSSSFCHPDTPNAAEVMKLFLKFERETLHPYSTPGNNMSRNMYDDLPLPWTINIPVPEFPQSLYVKHDYDREGVLSNGKTFFGRRGHFGQGNLTTLDDIEKGLGTASMVTRWRAAHPELANTDRDAVKVFVNDCRRVLGPDVKGIETGSGTAILLFKRA